MTELEDISFRNRVLFFEEELLRLHRTGRPFLRKTRRNKQHWNKVFHVRSGDIKNCGKCVYLTPRAIAVLTGVSELDDIDDVRITPTPRIDVLNLVDIESP